MRTPSARQATIAPTANTSLVPITAVGRSAFGRASSDVIIAAAAPRSIGP